MGGRYQAYPEYKYSQSEWLGDIPNHWEACPVKYLSNSVSTGGTPKNQSSFTDGNQVCWFSPSDFDGREILLSSSKYVTNESCEIGDARLYKGGSVVVIGIGATLGKVAYCPNSFSCNQQINVIAPNEKVLGMYLMYSLALQLEQMKQTSNASTIGIMNQEKTKTILVAYPPKLEQQKITNFLDHETAKIDTLIEKQQQLIALLKEKRQAVISHAVTKGLNPNAPMRDFGVEWLGDVPAHWDVAAVRRYLVEHRQGYYTTDAYIEDGTKLLRITDLRELGEISTINCPKVPASASLSNYLLEEGDVVFARTGGAGSFGVIPELDEEVAYASYLIRFRFLPRHFNRDYLRFMLVSDSFQLAVKKNIHGGVNQNIHAEDIKDTFVASPPLAEQKEISLYLEKQSRKYAELIEKAESAIFLMQERRTALISAAVTGKIDVRNWSAN